MPAPPPPGSAARFSDLGLAASLVTAVAALGYEEPTPIQRAAIPILLAGGDLLAQAATGTGKTAAFALPLIDRLRRDDPDAPRAGAPRKGGRAIRRTGGLVLVPTRELAMQVAEALHKYAHGTPLAVVPLYGGAAIQQQIRALERGADIVVATPGRAIDHLQRQTLSLDAVRVLVLDEADEMLDLGFADDIDTILTATPVQRQTALFSATMPARLRAIAERHLRDPQRIAIAEEKRAADKRPRVRQAAYIVARAQKPAALQRVLDLEQPASAIVFCRTRLEVDSLVETLNAHGYRAEALHGGMQQRHREAVIARFRAAKADLLVATDVAARGLDIPHISHIINYDVPSAPDAYVHRIGRTGRAGREGVAITLAEPREHRFLNSIERVTKQKIEIVTLPTVADLRARRLELTRAAIHEQLVAGHLDDVRVVVESLAQEFDILDVAAAAVKLAHAASSGGKDETDLPPPAERRDEPRAGARTRPAGDAASPSVRLFIGAGRRDGIRPADVVGAIVNEAGLSPRDLGAIQIADGFSLVEVPAASADEVVQVMRRATVRGHKVEVRRERDGRPGGEGSRTRPPRRGGA